jgi:hypothetical protein
VRTYRVDAPGRQLLRRDEATGGSIPVIDGVTSMRIEYLDSGRRLRLEMRLAASLPQARDLVVTLDARPPNLQAP